MAKQRTGATDLARLFNQFSFPFYILDGDGKIRFCNKACLDWLGTEPEAVVGKRPRYRAFDEPMDHATPVDGLAAPPSAAIGARTEGVVWRIDKEGRMPRRRARFAAIPLETAGPSVLAVCVSSEDIDVSSEDLGENPLAESPEAEVSPSRPGDERHESECLHETLLRLRRRRGDERALASLLGETPAMGLVRRRVALAARTDLPVTIHGPSGSGRRHTAEAIHFSQADSSGKRLVPLDCDILDGDLILTAVSAMATANRVDESGKRIGTLLMAEADRLPPETHGPLYEFFSDRRRRFPFRLLVTARAPLTSLPRTVFLPELAALLGALEIEIPPLADRRPDIPLLAQYFLERANAECDIQREGFLPETLDALDGYAWPGNVGELARAVFDAFDAAEGPWISRKDLPRRLYHAAQAEAYPEPSVESISLDDTLLEIERELLRRALDQADGNKAEAARLLGITRPRLYRRAVALGLEEATEG